MITLGVEMTGFDAAPVELQVCGSALTEIGDELRTELDRLKSEMDELFAAGWQGKAADGFAQGWDWWRAGAREVLGALRDMAGLLTETGRNYQGTDDTAAGDVRDAGAGL